MVVSPKAKSIANANFLALLSIGPIGETGKRIRMFNNRYRDLHGFLFLT